MDLWQRLVYLFRGTRPRCAHPARRAERPATTRPSCQAGRSKRTPRDQAFLGGRLSFFRVLHAPLFGPMFSKHGLWMAIRWAALPRVLPVLPFLCMVTAPDAGGPLSALGLLPKVPVADPIGIVTIPKVSVADPNVIVIIPMVIVADPNDIVTDPLVKGPAGTPEQRAEPHAPPFPATRNTPKPLPSLGCSEFWPSWRRWLFGPGNDGYLPDSQHFDQQGSKKCRERRFVPISRCRHVVPLSPMVIMIIPTPDALGRCQRRNRASFRGTRRKARPPPATLSSDLPYLLGPARIHRRARRSGGGHGKPAREAPCKGYTQDSELEHASTGPERPQPQAADHESPLH